MMKNKPTIWIMFVLQAALKFNLFWGHFGQWASLRNKYITYVYIFPTDPNCTFQFVIYPSGLLSQVVFLRGGLLKQRIL